MSENGERIAAGFCLTLALPRLRAAVFRGSVSAAGLILASALSATVARADDPTDVLNALMMGGTTMSTPTLAWMDSAIDYYLDHLDAGVSYAPIGVTTTEGGVIGADIQSGLSALQTAMETQQQEFPNEPYLIEGYSQSALIAVAEDRELGAALAAGRPVPDVTIALLGSGTRPAGGILERFTGVYVPIIELAGSGAEPVDSGIATVDIAGQYDGFADFPEYPLNPVADLNALLGIIYVHTNYGNLLGDQGLPGATATPLGGPTVDEYVLGSTEIVKQVDGDATFYFIPTTELPLLDPLHSLGVPESVLNIFQPALQVIVEAGYDRSIPFGDATPFELIPSIDPATFTLELANASVQGLDNAFELFGAQLPGATELESMLTSAETWSELNIGVPYDQVVTELNNAFNPFTFLTQLEGPLGVDIQNLLDLTGIQQTIFDPLLGLIADINI